MKIIHKTSPNIYLVEEMTYEIKSKFENNLKDKDNDELYHVCKYIAKEKCQGLRINLLEICNPPKPDFILDLNGKKIGLEHTRLEKQEKAEKINIINKLLREAEERYIKEYGNIGKLICFKLIGDLKFKKNDKKVVIDKIIELVNLYIEQGQIRLRDNFFFSISYSMPNRKPKPITCFEFDGGVHIIPDIELEYLNTVIREKNNKKYEINGLDELWLLLVETNYLKTFHTDFIAENESVIENNFDRIIIFRSFALEIKIIKETTNN